MNIEKKILSSIGHFSPEEAEQFAAAANKKDFEAGAVLLNQGAICNQVYYIISGEAIQFQVPDIDEHIIELYCSNDWCLNNTSFTTQKPSLSVIRAYSPLTVLEFTTTSIHQLIAASPSFFQLGKLLDQTTSRINYFDNDYNAAARYNHLALTRPEVLQKFPLKIIASYLKISPETLSRIRGKK